MSFNILSDAPIWKKKWEHLPKEKWIYWDYRKKLILDIIKDVNADILCLMEIEYRQIDFFSCNLCKLYNYIYVSGEPKRTKESAKKYNNWTHDKNSGIIIMFKKDRIRIINNSSLNYENYFREIAEKEKWNYAKLHHFIKPCVSNTVLFEDMKTDKRFYFTALHHFNDPKYGDVKYYQIYVLLQQIINMNKFYNYPIIVAGDFNTMPNSAVIKFMKTGKLYKDELYEKKYMIPKENINKIGLPDKLEGYKQLVSGHEKYFGYEPKYTTYTDHFKNCIDYIFLSEDIKVVKFNDFMEKIENWIKRNMLMPNSEFPSDHINLIIDIEI